MVPGPHYKGTSSRRCPCLFPRLSTPLRVTGTPNFDTHRLRKPDCWSNLNVYFFSCVEESTDTETGDNVVDLVVGVIRETPMGLRNGLTILTGDTGRRTRVTWFLVHYLRFSYQTGDVLESAKCRTDLKYRSKGNRHFTIIYMDQREDPNVSIKLTFSKLFSLYNVLRKFWSDNNVTHSMWT